MYLENGKLLFDKEKCENCYQEALAWDEETHYEKVMYQYKKKYNHIEFMEFRYSKHSKRWVAHPDKRMMKDPKKERLYKKRKRDNWHFNESKQARKEVQRHIK